MVELLLELLDPLFGREAVELDTVFEPPELVPPPIEGPEKDVEAPLLPVEIEVPALFDDCPPFTFDVPGSLDAVLATPPFELVPSAVDGPFVG
ncbi:MAG: hypothetical protein ABSC94_31910 [Polyangiaceae bacterium]